MSAHVGFNNFHAEAPFARALRPYVPANGRVPESVVVKYIKTLTMCRIGNGYGVSWGGEAIYTELIDRWQEREIRLFVNLPMDSDVSSRMQLALPARLYQKLAAGFVLRVTNAAIKALLEFIVAFPQGSMSKMWTDHRYTELAKAIA